MVFFAQPDRSAAVNLGRNVDYNISGVVLDRLGHRVIDQIVHASVCSNKACRPVVYTCLTNHAGRYEFKFNFKEGLGTPSLTLKVISAAGDVLHENVRPFHLDAEHNTFYQNEISIVLESELADPPAPIDFDGFLEAKFGHLKRTLLIDLSKPIDILTYAWPEDLHQNIGVKILAGKDVLGNPCFAWIGKADSNHVLNTWILTVFHPFGADRVDGKKIICTDRQFNQIPGSDFLLLKRASLLEISSDDYALGDVNIAWEVIFQRLHWIWAF